MKKAVKKYIQPKSLTFWSGMVPLAAGLVMAVSKSIPQLQPVAIVVDAIFGGVPPSMLINGGIAAIGLRAAISN